MCQQTFSTKMYYGNNPGETAEIALQYGISFKQCKKLIKSAIFIIFNGCVTKLLYFY